MGYREFSPPPALAGAVACTWTERVAADGVKRIAPDGCADLIWDGDRLVVAGPDTGPRLAPLRAGTALAGVRLRPGAAGPGLGVRAAALRDGTVALAELWGDGAHRLADALAGTAPASAAARRALLAAVAARPAPPDPLVTEAVRRLEEPGVRVDDLAAGLFVSERQLRRRFDAAVGYGPRALARVLRLQRLRGLDPSASLAERALDAGYADQAHMGADVRRLVGTTPGAWLPT